MVDIHFRDGLIHCKGNHIVDAIVVASYEVLLSHSSNKNSWEYEGEV